MLINTGYVHKSGIFYHNCHMSHIMSYSSFVMINNPTQWDALPISKNGRLGDG